MLQSSSLHNHPSIAKEISANRILYKYTFTFIMHSTWILFTLAASQFTTTASANPILGPVADNAVLKARGKPENLITLMDIHSKGRIFRLDLPILIIQTALEEAISSGPSVVRKVNPFSGVSTKPYSGSGCSGDSQGNTNINCGTTDCINISDAESFALIADRSSQASLEYFSDTNCEGKSLGTFNQDASACVTKPNRASSFHVNPLC